MALMASSIHSASGGVSASQARGSFFATGAGAMVMVVVEEEEEAEVEVEVVVVMDAAQRLAPTDLSLMPVAN